MVQADGAAGGARAQAEAEAQEVGSLLGVRLAAVTDVASDEMASAQSKAEEVKTAFETKAEGLKSAAESKVEEVKALVETKKEEVISATESKAENMLEAGKSKAEETLGSLLGSLVMSESDVELITEEVESGAEVIGDELESGAEIMAEMAESGLEAANDETESMVEEFEIPEAPMTYEEFVNAEENQPVMVETYVQAKQAWGDGCASIYTQNEDGAYFLYKVECSEEDYNALEVGQKILVNGFKAVWSGEDEIADAYIETEDGEFIAEATDVTELLGSDELEAYKNQKVSFKGMTVEASDNGGEEAAFLYNWDGSGAEGDDLYFTVSYNGNEYSFTVETDLCDKDSDVYKAVQNLKVGDVVDVEGFLYWYEGPNPHITSVTVE